MMIIEINLVVPCKIKVRQSHFRNEVFTRKRLPMKKLIQMFVLLERLVSLDNLKATGSSQNENSLT